MKRSPFKADPEKRARDECDSLARQLVQARDPHCRRCGNRPVETAHIIRREFWRTRCDLTNLVGLCRECHAGEHAKKWAWPELIGQDEYERLRELAYSTSSPMVKRPHDWFRSERSRLRELWKETA